MTRKQLEGLRPGDRLQYVGGATGRVAVTVTGIQFDLIGLSQGNTFLGRYTPKYIMLRFELIQNGLEAAIERLEE
jgi:hypothetical protein